MAARSRSSNYRRLLGLRSRCLRSTSRIEQPTTRSRSATAPTSSSPPSPNEYINLTAYPDYKGEPKAQVKDVSFKIYQTPDAAYVDLLANNLDVLDTMPTTALAGDRWKSELGDRSLLQPVGVFQSITYPLYDKKFENVDLRKAISMSIDRAAIIKIVFNNTRSRRRLGLAGHRGLRGGRLR